MSCLIRQFTIFDFTTLLIYLREQYLHDAIMEYTTELHHSHYKVICMYLIGQHSTSPNDIALFGGGSVSTNTALL